MHTAYLSDEDLAAAHLEQPHDVEAGVADALAAAGPDSRLRMLPGAR
jgi:lactate racemase